MDLKNDVVFYQNYINPFYGGCMNFNIISKSVVPDPIEFIDKIYKIKDDLSDEQIIELLQGNINWRTSKVAADIIGFCKLYQLEPYLFDYIYRNPNHCEHAFLAITILNSKTSAKALLQLLQAGLDKLLHLLHESQNNRSLELKALDIFDRYDLNYIYGAISYLDIVNDTKNKKNNGIQSSTWASIKIEISRIIENSPRYKDMWSKVIDDFEKDTSYIFDEVFLVMDKLKSR